MLNGRALTGDAAAWGYASASSYDGLDRLAGLSESGHPIAERASLDRGGLAGKARRGKSGGGR